MVPGVREALFRQAPQGRREPPAEDQHGGGQGEERENPQQNRVVAQPGQGDIGGRAALDTQHRHRLALILHRRKATHIGHVIVGEIEHRGAGLPAQGLLQLEAVSREVAVGLSRGGGVGRGIHQGAAVGRHQEHPPRPGAVGHPLEPLQQVGVGALAVGLEAGDDPFEHEGGGGGGGVAQALADLFLDAGARGQKAQQNQTHDEEGGRGEGGP